jgi:hypothetical protein
MARTVIQAAVTKSAPFTPGAGVDISGLSIDSTLWLVVSNSNGAGLIRMHFEDSVNAFTAFLVGPSTSFKGRAKPYNRSWRLNRDWPGLRLGTPSAVLRLVLDTIAAANVTYSAYIE